MLLTAHLKPADSTDVAHVTIGFGAFVIGIKASGTTALLIGGGIAVGVCLVAGGIAYGVIKSMEKEKSS